MTYQPNLHSASMVGPDLQSRIALKEVGWLQFEARFRRRHYREIFLTGHVMEAQCVPHYNVRILNVAIPGWKHVKYSRLWIDSHYGRHIISSAQWMGRPTARYRWSGWVWNGTGLKFKTSGKLPIIYKNLQNLHLNLMKETRKMSTCTVGLGNTRILTDYAKKYCWILLQPLC